MQQHSVETYAVTHLLTLSSVTILAGNTLAESRGDQHLQVPFRCVDASCVYLPSVFNDRSKRILLSICFAFRMFRINSWEEQHH